MAKVGDMNVSIQIREAAFAGINSYFTWTMVCLFSGGMLIWIVQFWRGRPIPEVAANLPGILTSLGILGTFVGILLGLVGFNVDDLPGSVPKLLEGMKTAFVTSVVGVALAIGLKIFLSIQRTAQTTSEGVGADEIHRVLVDIREEAQKQNSETSAQLSKLIESIGGTGDKTLVSQTALLRGEVSDGFNRLTTEFRVFADRVSELGSKALIEALRNVITDFNKQLTEQFGQNFRELNNAVGALVTWQDQHKAHVERLTADFEKSLNTIEAARDALADVAKHCTEIPATMQALKAILQIVDDQEKRLAEQLQAYATLGQKAVDAFPMIESNLTTLTSEFGKSVEKTVSSSAQILQRHDAAFALLNKGFTEHSNQVDGLTKTFVDTQNMALAELTDAFQDVRKSLQDILKQARTQYESLASEVLKLSQHQEKHLGDLYTGIEDTFRKSSDALNARLERMFNESAANVNKSNAELSQIMKEQFRNFDKEIGDELSRVITDLGRKLGGLNERIVQDYRPLYQKVGELLDGLRYPTQGR